MPLQFSDSKLVHHFPMTRMQRLRFGSHHNTTTITWLKKYNYSSPAHSRAETVIDPIF